MQAPGVQAQGGTEQAEWSGWTGGQGIGKIGASAYRDIMLSPDGTHLAYGLPIRSSPPKYLGPRLKRDVSSRLTLMQGRHLAICPDGQSLAFSSNRSACLPCTRSPNVRQRVQIVPHDSTVMWDHRLVRDGRLFGLSESLPASGCGHVRNRIGAAHRLLTSTFNENLPSFPRCRYWRIQATNRSFELYLIEPDGVAAMAVSSNVGVFPTGAPTAASCSSWPQWSDDGRVGDSWATLQVGTPASCSR